MKKMAWHHLNKCKGYCSVVCKLNLHSSSQHNLKFYLILMNYETSLMFKLSSLHPETLLFCCCLFKFFPVVPIFFNRHQADPKSPYVITHRINNFKFSQKDKLLTHIKACVFSIIHYVDCQNKEANEAGGCIVHLEINLYLFIYSYFQNVTFEFVLS